jgi:hypothetical protein
MLNKVMVQSGLFPGLVLPNQPGDGNGFDRAIAPFPLRSLKPTTVFEAT